ncbi:hypothetical protein [Streptomyces sp. A1499]|uniref:hypothetical protein n=1 Tax=Streptomyces sp. A1499 TaxID=2563104 RepID=UPI00109E5CE5|nr:hypothetical protein [Streptomyces sp. A1499]THC53139.1 hypothetical protein E7X58_07710 [Streptomyces sp. A1499]
MADEQEKWLDPDAAERLLRGEPLDDVDPHVRAQADRLAQALGALAAEDRGTVPAEAELPGEAAALAAFRAARADSAKAGARAAYATSAHETAAAKTVRLGRAADRPRPSRWGRPVRLGLAAALAGCMIGGVAVGAGTGVLPSPFGEQHEPEPAASATAVATPDEPRPSPSDGAGEPPEEQAQDDGEAPDDEAATREPETSRASEAEADGAPTGQPTRRPGAVPRPPRTDGAKDWYRKVVIACRDYRSGELQGDKRRRLEEFAKGTARVEEFCGRVLGGQHGGGQGSGRPNGGQQGGNGGDGGDHGEGGDGDSDEAPGDDGGAAGGAGGDTGGIPGFPATTAPAAPAAGDSGLPAVR